VGDRATVSSGPRSQIIHSHIHLLLLLLFQNENEEPEDEEPSVAIVANGQHEHEQLIVVTDDGDGDVRGCVSVVLLPTALGVLAEPVIQDSGPVSPVIHPIFKRDRDAFELFQRVRTREGWRSVGRGCSVSWAGM